jgi:hypothetical protein
MSMLQLAAELLFSACKEMKTLNDNDDDDVVVVAAAAAVVVVVVVSCSMSALQVKLCLFQMRFSTNKILIIF